MLPVAEVQCVMALCMYDAFEVGGVMVSTPWWEKLLVL